MYSYSPVAQLVEQRVASSSLTTGGVTVLSKTIYLLLILVQPRKPCIDMTEKLLTGI